MEALPGNCSEGSVVVVRKRGSEQRMFQVSAGELSSVSS